MISAIFDFRSTKSFLRLYPFILLLSWCRLGEFKKLKTDGTKSGDKGSSVFAEK